MTKEKIDSFTGEYYFLSNFYMAPITYDGWDYTNNEAAFQAQKTSSRILRVQLFSGANPSEAKRQGRSIKLRADWEDVKDNIMYEIVRAKFSQNPDLKEKLLATGDKLLEEGNTWGDVVWGTVDGVGENRLGKILMRVRSELAEKDNRKE